MIEWEPQTQGLSSQQHSPQTPRFYSQLDFNAQPRLSSVGKASPAKGGKAPLPLLAPVQGQGRWGRAASFIHRTNYLRPPSWALLLLAVSCPSTLPQFVLLFLF